MKTAIKDTQQKPDLDYRINRARLAGANKGCTLADFKNYLLDIGLNRYEKLILPIETEGEYPGAMVEQPQQGKIISFPFPQANRFSGSA